MFEVWLNQMIAAYGQLGLLFVMVVQTIIAPIPSEALLMFAGAIGVSLVDVTLFGGIGLIIGAVVAFLIARYGGRPLVEKMLGRKWTAVIDTWVSENGARAIFVTRLVPFIPFDLISYISGITSLSFKSYLVATVAGAFRRCLMLAVIGGTAGRILMLLGIGLELMFLIAMVGLVVLLYLDRKGYMGSVERGIIGRIMKRVFTVGSKPKSKSGMKKRPGLKNVE